MDTLKRFLCDWGSPDSNMLLFFLLTSFLLGLLAGWLIWGRKIQAMLAQVEERDATISDLNTKLTLKEADLAKTNKSNEELMAKNRAVSEEKGQLYAELMASRDEFEKYKLNLAAPSILAAAGIITPPSVVIEEPAAESVMEILNEDESSTTESQEETATTIVIPDDLKIVEGIGPKIEGLLNDGGIWTFKQLADAPIERLHEILEAAGRRYQMHDPSTWSRQSLMAFEGKWDELKAWQDALKGGKE